MGDKKGGGKGGKGVGPEVPGNISAMNENTEKRITELTMLLIFLTSRQGMVRTVIFDNEAFKSWPDYPPRLLKEMDNDNLIKVYLNSCIELTPKGIKRAVRLMDKPLVKDIRIQEDYDIVCDLILLLSYLSGRYERKVETGQKVFTAPPSYLPRVLETLKHHRLIWRYRFSIVLTTEGIIMGAALRDKYIRIRGGSKSPNIEVIKEIIIRLRIDVTACGRMLGQAYERLHLPLFEHTDSMFAVRYGTHRFLPGELRAGQREIEVPPGTTSPDRFSQVLIHDKEYLDHELNTIQTCNGGRLILKEGLGGDYPEGSGVVVFNHIVWRFCRDRGSLFRECNGKRYELPVKVTGFNFTYFPDSRSLLCLIELDEKEQVRGFLDFVNAPFDPFDRD